MSLFRAFLIADAIAFVVLSAACIALGAPEIIVGLVAGYILGFQTGGES
jgi:hypothetical protein